VALEKNYSVRVKKQAADEIGLLFDSFNEMFTQIQLRDHSLQEAHDSLEQRVLERTVELERSNKDLEAFSFSVSHDLRAPLRAIDGFTRILQEDQATKFGEEGQHAVDIILKSVQKMGQLIDDLLVFSRLGKQEPRMISINMTALTKSVVEEIKFQNPDRTVDVKLSLLQDAKGDPALLRQVFTNLLSNAFKYSRKAVNPKIEIASYLEKGEVVYSIKDNGVGFDMKYKDKLFGVFQRLHGSKEFEGTGVGLAIVKRIIDRHGGRVWAEAKVNEGATFYFTLPALDA
jgi:light-regulated signal transduction histidine kinase (bacteriophytochrome)